MDGWVALRLVVGWVQYFLSLLLSKVFCKFFGYLAAGLNDESIETTPIRLRLSSYSRLSLLPVHPFKSLYDPV